LLDALNHTKADFELVITSQHELPENYMVDDRRVKYSIKNEQDVEKLYTDLDALILPRRYGGLSLTTNEALMSGLPVLMPDISPNNQLLPRDWLYKAHLAGQFKTRTMVDVYATHPHVLAKKIDWLVKQDLHKLKVDAFELGYNSFSETALREQYEELWEK